MPLHDVPPIALPFMSVVIPCRNAAPWIGEQLAALHRQRFEASWEVVVVDNGSTDGSAAAARKHGEGLPGFRIVTAAGRARPGFARNAGVANARGRFIAFCDADDVVADNWLVEITRALCEHPFVACRLEHALLNPHWPVTPDNAPQVSGLEASAFLETAGAGTIGIERDLFWRVGGFDASMRTHEDHELCWRVQLDGVPLRFAPRAVVHYRYRQKLRGMFRKHFCYGYDQMRLIRRYRARGYDIPTKRARGFLLQCARITAGLPAAFVHRRGRNQLAYLASTFGTFLACLSGSPRSQPDQECAEPARAGRGRGFRFGSRLSV